jgi:hypothetical protein
MVFEQAHKMRPASHYKCHERKRGKGAGPDSPETYDIPLGHSRHDLKRTAICHVTRLERWNKIRVSIHHHAGHGSYKLAPKPSEVARLIPFFFFPDEQVVVFPLEGKQAWLELWQPFTPIDRP